MRGGGVVATLVGLAIACGAGAQPGKPTTAAPAGDGESTRSAAPTTVADREVDPRAGNQEGRLSGLDHLSSTTRQMQLDDAQNPGMLWVEGGRQRFAEQCSGCHATSAMTGVATRYPALDASTGQPVTLAGRIRQCHTSRMHQPPPAWESRALLELASYLGWRSRGLPIVRPGDEPVMIEAAERGRLLWAQRLGQVDLSCADCHDRLAGRRLAGSTIPQAHPTGYPIYRLEWQAVGSLQRRMRGCLSGVRAEPFPYGADEWIALEIHLRRRAAGMAVETPAVRP